jgi:hypothetical protein
MDHRPTRNNCIWCHEPWPCQVAKFRLEAAKVVLAEVEQNKAHRPNWVRGMTDAATLLLKGLTSK